MLLSLLASGLASAAGAGGIAAVELYKLMRGVVGSTGRSTACMLHFEMWTAPGWYRGGKVADPTPYLKDWDRKD